MSWGDTLGSGKLLKNKKKKKKEEDDDEDGEDKSKKHGQSLMKLNTYKAICFVQTRWARALASLSKSWTPRSPRTLNVVYSTIR